MCTVTFIARQRGYRLGMNRDEKRTRRAGLPPKGKRVNGRVVVAPSEPGGGTWISVNDRGVTFALINWHAITGRSHGIPVSRGEVVNQVSAESSADSAGAALAKLSLRRIKPFRLIGVFPARGEIVEWRWDLKRLARRKHRWEPRQWVSSGFDEPGAQRVRATTFKRALKQRSAGSAEWLRRLHRSHAPETGPYSTCMHRADAVTVSYTEVAVSARRAAMRHHQGAPCESAVCSSHKISMIP